MKGAKLEKAIISYLDGTLSEPECRELQQTLLRDRAARDLYRQHAQLQQSFIFRYSQAARAAKKRPSIAELQHRQQQKRNFKLALGAAAAAIVAIGIALQFIFVSPSPSIATVESTPGTQYTIHHTQNDKGEGKAVSSGQLAPGSTIELSQGMLEVTLEKGVRAVFLAPASFQLIDEKLLYLNRGTAWFRVEEEGQGFKVVTRQFSATDLGTEFGIIAAPHQPDEVHVFEGKVQVSTSHKNGMEETLGAGQSRKCSAIGMLDEIVSSPATFLKELPQAAPDNLIFNGGFELGNHPADRNWGEPASASILPGWAFSPGITIARRSANGKPGYGEGSTNILSSTADTQLGFNVNPQGRPDPASATIRQTFPTIPGQTYRVTFEMGAFIHAPNTMELFTAIFDGADHNSSTGTLLAHHTERRTPSQGHGYNPPAAFTFTAASTRATIVFTETSNNSNGADVTLDNIRIHQTTDR